VRTPKTKTSTTRHSRRRAGKPSAPRSSPRIAGVSKSRAAEGRRSTAASLLRSAPGWSGEDLEDVVRIVTESRSKARF
jgi:predicted secreted protein